VRQRLQGDPALCDAALGEARRAGLARAVRERDLALLLGRIAEIRSEGAVYLDHARLMGANADVGRAALAAALRTAGGGAYGPAAEAVARLHGAISGAAFRGASLAGCAIRLNRDRLMICREPGRIAPGQALTADRWTRWDGRFVLRVQGPIAHALTLGALGWLDFARLRRGIATSVPAIVAAGLPALRIGGDLVAAPGLGWAATAAPEVDHSFEPLWPLSSETFTVVSGGPDIMFDDGREQR
jgi:tRNA(Ile)-lysidine synthase